jgi:Ran GTPase-activating protein (RanGAP) involved in mRNA processing and transport
LINLIQSIEVCESDHVSWYGFQLNTNIQKESHEYYKKSFNCNLETLILKGTNLKTFENINDIKNVNFINHFKTLLNKSKKLDTLILDFCIINKYFFDILTNALQDENQLKYLSLTHSNINGDTLKSFLHAFKDKDKKEINKNFHIEALNLSCNLLGYSGIEGLCEVLKTNKTIKYLNLYHNLFDVNGARRIGEILKENTTLEKLDIGYNRIRNVGFNSIMDGIKENNNIKLKYLGVKYNFIRNNSLESNLDNLNSKTTIPLEEIELKKNPFTDEFINKFYKDKFNSFNTDSSEEFLRKLYLTPKYFNPIFLFFFIPSKIELKPSFLILL